MTATGFTYKAVLMQTDQSKIVTMGATVTEDQHCQRIKEFAKNQKQNICSHHQRRHRRRRTSCDHVSQAFSSAASEWRNKMKHLWSWCPFSILAGWQLMIGNVGMRFSLKPSRDSFSCSFFPPLAFSFSFSLTLVGYFFKWWTCLNLLCVVEISAVFKI